MKKRDYILFFLCLFYLLYTVAALSKETTITIEKLMPPPNWALLERVMLKANVEAASEFADKYLDDRGYLSCVENWGGNDGPGDAMENFQNWTLLYALGASEIVLDMYKKAWEGHLEQFTNGRIEDIDLAKDGMYYKEFITSFDWEHTGEGLQAFYFYGLCKPTDPQYLQRLRRYAGFYMNEDPEAPNYDPKHKIIRSLFNGSRGPKLTAASMKDWSGNPRPGHPELVNRYSRSQNISGDHPLNLATASLVFNAYAITHEDKYRDWLLEYITAWRDRVKANNGNIPSNIGQNGEIGGEWDGKWYGGIFGWNDTVSVRDSQGKIKRYSRNYVVRGPRIAFGEAYLLTGDESYIETLHSQIKNLYAVKKMKNNQLLLPKYHGENGWFGFTTDKREYLPIQHDIYFWTMRRSDLRWLPKEGWIEYLEGKDPDYPEKIRQQELEMIRQRVKELREDSSTPDTRRSDTSQKYNPVTITALVNLMLGGNYPDHRGNILHCRVRYFDPVRQRAGLPVDIAALVEKINPNSIDLILVNTNQVHGRKVIIQMGAYAEHHCTSVRIREQTIPVDAPYFNVRLAPGAGETLTIDVKRYFYQPTLAFPWDRSWMVKK